MGFPLTVSLTDEQVRAQSVTQVHPLGTKGVTRDGRAFRYMQAGAAIAIGRVLQARAPSTNFSDDQTFNTAYAIGTTKVTINIVSTAAHDSDGSTNYFKDGYLMVNHGTGLGAMSQIFKQGGWDTATASGLKSTVHIRGGLKAAVTSGTEVGFILNPYKKVVMAPKAQTNAVVGVSPIAVTISYFFWGQTGGMAAVRFGGTGRIGRAAVFDAGTNTGYITAKSSDMGFVGSSFSSELKLAYSMPELGDIMEVGATGETGIVRLKLDS